MSQKHLLHEKSLELIHRIHYKPLDLQPPHHLQKHTRYRGWRYTDYTEFAFLTPTCAEPQDNLAGGCNLGK